MGWYDEEKDVTNMMMKALGCASGILFLHPLRYPLQRSIIPQLAKISVFEFCTIHITVEFMTCCEQTSFKVALYITAATLNRAIAIVRSIRDCAFACDCLMPSKIRDIGAKQNTHAIVPYAQ
jgi:hypothetical protein